MVARRSSLLAAVAILAGGASAAAAVAPAGHTLFLYVAKGHFEIQFRTGTARQITAGVPQLKGGAVVSSILVVCPVAPGGAVTELHVGFPGAKLALVGRHLGFSRSYTYRHAPLVAITSKGFGKTTFVRSTRVTVAGTVTSPKLITGTVSVSAPGCDLKPSTYKAAFFRTLSG